MKTTIRRTALYLCTLLCIVSLLSSCKKKETTEVIQETGTVTDVDNNTYKTIKIGNQWWMAEDLNVRKYRNGDYINRVQSDTSVWENDTVGSFCDIVDNNSIAYGKWYNWYAIVNAKNIAPEGWHIPTDEDWKQLEKSLGMTQSEIDHFGWRGNNEGDMLKKKAPEGWTIFQNVWGTNESGFAATANGCKLYNFKNGDPGQYATEFWWTKSDVGSNEAVYRYLDYKSTAIFRSHTYKNYGFSVRCVKD
jgi:uncharacterized protein (TIGR02145 family)